MQRLLESDVDELRGKYLFDLAHLCHCPAPLVDALRYLDFIQYLVSIDSYHKSMQKAVEGG